MFNHYHRRADDTFWLHSEELSRAGVFGNSKYSANFLKTNAIEADEKSFTNSLTELNEKKKNWADVRPRSHCLSSPHPKGSSLWSGEIKDPRNEVCRRFQKLFEQLANG